MNALNGKWSYLSFRHDPIVVKEGAVVGDPDRQVSGMNTLSLKLLPLLVAIACAVEPASTQAQTELPKTVEQAMERYVMEQPREYDVVQALQNIVYDAGEATADIEHGTSAALKGGDAAYELLSGGFDVVLAGSAIARSGGAGAVRAAFDVIMGALTEPPEAMMEKRLAALEQTVANLQERAANAEKMLQILSQSNVQNYSIYHDGADADPANNNPNGVCQGDLSCSRYTTVHNEFYFFTPQARALCSDSPAQAPNAERAAHDVLMAVTLDPKLGSAAAQLMLAAAASLLGRRSQSRGQKVAPSRRCRQRNPRQMRFQQA